MAHRGKRSQKSIVKRFILDTSFHDPNAAETISLVTDVMVIQFLDSEYPTLPPLEVDVVRGEVLIDSRGEGSMQR